MKCIENENERNEIISTKKEASWQWNQISKYENNNNENQWKSKASKICEMAKIMKYQKESNEMKEMKIGENEINGNENDNKE